ncbi:MAG: hypothetical protein ACTHLE_09250 [Agriterribacter sp.]
MFVIMSINGNKEEFLRQNGQQWNAGCNGIKLSYVPLPVTLRHEASIG